MHALAAPVWLATFVAAGLAIATACTVPTAAPEVTPGPTPTLAPTATSMPQGSRAVGPLDEAAGGCVSTASDGPGPNYSPGAPRRDSIGTGYALTGAVLLPGTCEPAAGALVEVWMAGPDGVYGDDYRASLVTDAHGRFRLESHAPPGYSGAPPHIHLRLSAPGYGELFLIHQPAAGAVAGHVAAVLSSE